jgi:hypothetical protein
MSYKKLLTISLIIFGIVVILFASGSSVLTYNIFGIPAGSFIIWFGFIALQLCAFSLKKGFNSSESLFGKILRILMISLIITSVLWFGFAYLLSGNLNFNFGDKATGYVGSPEASILYWNIIYTLIIAPLVILIAYTLLTYFESLQRS